MLQLISRILLRFTSEPTTNLSPMVFMGDCFSEDYFAILLTICQLVSSSFLHRVFLLGTWYPTCLAEPPQFPLILCCIVEILFLSYPR